MGPYVGGIWDPTFSPDGKRLAFAAQHDGRGFVVCDGKKGKTYAGQAKTPRFSPDGKRLAYCVQQGGRWRVVLDGKEFGPYDTMRSTRRSRTIRFADSIPQVGRPLFSPDGKHLAWIGSRGGKQFVVCDGREGPAYLSITVPRFSADSRHITYHAQKRAEGAQLDAYAMVVDGLESPASPVIIPPHSSDPLKRLRYVTVKDKRFKLVEVDWPVGLDWTNGLKPAPGGEPR